MTTRIEVRRQCGRSVCTLRDGVLAARRLDAPEGRVRIALVSTVALLLAGDEVRIEVIVGPGVDLELQEIAGTVAYDMRGGSASWSVDVRVEEKGFLAWTAPPFVVADGADVVRSTGVTLAAGGRALLRETYVFGRTGQVGGDLLASTTAVLEDRPLLVEELDLARAPRSERAVLDRARCLDSVTFLGGRLAGPQGEVMQLERPGSIVRRMASRAHAADLDACYLSARGMGTSDR
ncbi:Urease accessory protein UreH-like protein (fragment) [metagenome]|uniref:Urease accessory protein UreH-like protein n=1 Tax=metagenome TaxID=256318 RepID=A0A2P2C406_9ZZZZ